MVPLIVFVAISELAGVIGAIFTSPAIPTWYAALIKPELAPPNWLFAPVWTALYFLMGVAAFLVWRKRSEGADATQIKRAITIFSVQLILNTLWSIIFFGLQNPGGALLEIAVLWFAILATMIAFYKISKWAAYLFVPYLAWVTFAAYLNWAIWTLN